MGNIIQVVQWQVRKFASDANKRGTLLTNDIKKLLLLIGRGSRSLHRNDRYASNVGHALVFVYLNLNLLAVILISHYENYLILWTA